MAVRAGALAGCHIIATKDVEQLADPQSGGAISNAFFIDEQRKRDAGFLPEDAGVEMLSATMRFVQRWSPVRLCSTCSAAW